MELSKGFLGPEANAVRYRAGRHELTKETPGMSVTINWRPAAKNDRSFGSGTSSDLTALEETFGKRINLGDLETLQAMARSSGNRKFYDEVIEAVEKHECIEIWGTW
jgi:hypothetical protein